MEKETERENKNYSRTINIGKSTVKEMHLKILRTYQMKVSFVCVFVFNIYFY